MAGSASRPRSQVATTGRRGLVLELSFAAIYAVAVVALGPISYAVIQIRIADALIPLSIVFGLPVVLDVTLGNIAEKRLSELAREVNQFNLKSRADRYQIKTIIREIMEPRPRFELGTLASSVFVTKAMLSAAKHLPG